jgi:pimeloyl-ACP methyl ester carboxylesterase
MLPEEIIAMTPFASPVREVALPQGTIRYREAGEGEPIVFVHGALVNGALWRDVVPALADRYRCIVPDWPLGSHTVAMQPDADLTPPGVARLISGFLDALALDRVTLVANDSGGAFCQIVVANYPDRVARLVLTNSDAFDNFPPKLFRGLRPGAHVPGFVWLLAHALCPPAFRRLRFIKRRVPGAILNGYLAPARRDAAVRRDLTKLLRGVSSRYTLDAARRLPAFRGPVLLAWAPEDRYMPFEHGRRLAALFPDARLVEIPDAWLLVPEDQPALLARRIDAFLAETGGRASGRTSSGAA